MTMINWISARVFHVRVYPVKIIIVNAPERFNVREGLSLVRYVFSPSFR